MIHSGRHKYYRLSTPHCIFQCLLYLALWHFSLANICFTFKAVSSNVTEARNSYVCGSKTKSNYRNVHMRRSIFWRGLLALIAPTESSRGSRPTFCLSTCRLQLRLINRTYPLFGPIIRTIGYYKIGKNNRRRCQIKISFGGSSLATRSSYLFVGLPLTTTHPTFSQRTQAIVGLFPRQTFD